MAERRPRPAIVGLLAVVLALAVVLGGCATIPTDGPVVPGSSAGREVDSGFDVLPVGPDVDDAPDDVVRGFLLASAGVDDDFGVARDYLTPSAGTRWQPTESTVVYDGSTPEVTLLDAEGAVADPAAAVEQLTARVVVPVVATIDAGGRYLPAAEGTTKEVELGLQRVSGQWRIGELADEVLVSDSEFELVYGAYELYFLDPTALFLVPETRWYPDRPSTATSLVTQLLAGPSQWLADAVGTAFPGGTRLGLEAVPVESGAARVDLTSAARLSTPEDRRLMQAQLVATLVPVPTVATVQMTVGGSPLEVPVESADVARDVAVDDAAVLVADGALARLRAGQVQAVDGLPELGDLPISHPAVSYGQVSYAVLAAERSQLLHLQPGSDATPEPLVVAADLTAPSFDHYRWIWSTPAASTGVVLAARAGGSVAEVEAPWLAGRRVSSLRISRDGARAVVASTDQAGVGHVDLAAVVRGEEGVPVRLDALGEDTVGSTLVAVEDVAWIDEVQVAALGRRAVDEEDAVHVLQLGGPQTPPLAPTPDAVSLASARGERSVVVATSAGEILEQAGAVWVPVPDVTGVRDPAFPG